MSARTKSLNGINNGFRIVDGCGLHEMEFCSDRRWRLPHFVLQEFPARLLREAVVWQPVGAGFLMRDARRFKGNCSTIDADQVAAQDHAKKCGDASELPSRGLLDVGLGSD